MSKSKSKLQLQKQQPVNVSSSRGTKTKKNRRSRRRNRGGFGTPSSKAITITRTEMWDNFSVLANDSSHTQYIYRKNFDTTTGPLWFKKQSTMWEQYEIKNVKLRIQSGAAMTTGGNYVLSYNTNYAEREAERTAEQLQAQGHAVTRPIRSGGIVTIDADALKGFRTNTSLRENAGWLFNLELITYGVNEACALALEITYTIIFRNPSSN